jgi:hypothetical protein
MASSKINILKYKLKVVMIIQEKLLIFILRFQLENNGI